MSNRQYSIKEFKDGILHEVEIAGEKREIFLPVKFSKISDQQLEVMDRILSAYEKEGVRMVVLQAPCGVGKTLIAEVLRQCLRQRMLYLPPHIELQEQFMRDFPGGVLLKGRANFPHGGNTGAEDFPGVTCADCSDGNLCRKNATGGGKGFKVCEYTKARSRFIEAETGISNLSYFLSAANYTGMFVPEKLDEEGEVIEGKDWGKWVGDKGKWFTVIDEAHVIEESVKGFLNVEFSIGRLREIDHFIENHCQWEKVEEFKAMSWPKPPLYDQEKNGWIYLGKLIEKLKYACLALADYLAQVEMMMDVEKDAGVVDREAIKKIRFVNGVFVLLASLKNVELTENDDGELEAKDWIYQPVRAMVAAKGRKVGDVVKIAFLPVRIDRYTNDLIWSHLDRVLLMSGTWVSHEVAAEELGLDLHGIDYRYIETENQWDKKRMPIMSLLGASVTKNNKGKPWNEQECWDRLVDNVCTAIDKHRKERVIIHSVSFELGKCLGDELALIYKGRVIVHGGDSEKINEFGDLVATTSGQDKTRCLREYKEKDDGILISPSIEMGVDLPNELCRGVIFAKCPWGDLGNRQVSKRKDQGQSGWRWYMVQAARKLMQGAFRGCRWKGDWCRIWLVDEQFDRLLGTPIVYQWFKSRMRPRGEVVCREIGAYVGDR